MTDKLVCHYTWKKTKDTEAFGDTKVSNVFFKAAQKCPLFRGPENKEDYKNTMLDVFKSTKQRYRNKLKPTEKELSPNKLVDQVLENARQLLEQYGGEFNQDNDDENQSTVQDESEFEDQEF